MSVADPVKFSLVQLVAPRDAARMRFTEIVYTCAALYPPKEWDATMKQLCKITWEADIDISTLPTWTNRLGKVFHKLRCEVEMTCTGGSVDFAIYHDGKRQGSKNAGVDYETED